MSKLRREIRDLKARQMRLINQLGDPEADQELLKQSMRPVKVLCDEKERALRVLEEQKRLKDDAADVECRIVAQCGKLAERVETLDFEGQRSLFAAFGMKVEAVH